MLAGMRVIAHIAWWLASVNAAFAEEVQPVERRALNLTVDLGYGIYNGVYNSTTDLNIWKGYVFKKCLSAFSLAILQPGC